MSSIVKKRFENVSDAEIKAAVDFGLKELDYIRKANENRAVSKNKLDQQFGKYIEENNKS